MPPRPSNSLGAAAYVGGVATIGWLWLDERFDLRKWRRVSYDVVQQSGAEPIRLSMRCRTRPPPIGCMEWPAGRVLLQWAVDEADIANEDGVILELGAGIGITAIGLAMARQQQQQKQQRRSVASVVATDVCDATLGLLRENAAAHGLSPDTLNVAKWDAAGGEASLATMPCRLDAVTHLVGADVVYHGFGVNNAADNTELEATTADVGFPHTLAALLKAKPSINVSLLIVDRFSGGAVAAVAASAGVPHQSTVEDPAISRFIRTCEELGLDVEKTPVPSAVLAKVAASQSLINRAYWYLAGHYAGMTILKVTPAPPGRHMYEHIAAGVHEGIGCDRSGVLPIIGPRYTIPGANYDLCEAEYLKLREEEQQRFRRVEPSRFYRRRGDGNGASVPVRLDLPPSA